MWNYIDSEESVQPLKRKGFEWYPVQDELLRHFYYQSLQINELKRYDKKFAIFSQKSTKTTFLKPFQKPIINVKSNTAVQEL